MSIIHFCNFDGDKDKHPWRKMNDQGQFEQMSFNQGLKITFRIEYLTKKVMI